MKTLVLWVSLLLAVVVAQDETPDDQDLDLDPLDLSKRLSDLEKSNARSKRLQEGIPELRHKLNETKKWLEKTNKNIHTLCAFTRSVHKEAKNAGRHISWDIRGQLYSLYGMSKSLKKLKLRLEQKEDKYSEDQIKTFMAGQWNKFKEEAANSIKQGDEPQEKTTQDKIVQDQIEKFMAGQLNKFKDEVVNNIKQEEEPKETTTPKGGQEKKALGSRFSNWFSSRRKAASTWVSNKYGATKSWFQKKFQGTKQNTEKKAGAADHEVARETADPVPKSETVDTTVDPAPIPETGDRTSDPALKSETVDTTVDPAPKPDKADMTSNPAPKVDITDMTGDPAAKPETEELKPIPAPKPPTADQNNEPGLELGKPAQGEAALTPDKVELFVSRELKSGRPDLVIEKTTDGSTPDVKEVPSVARDPNKMNNEASTEDQTKSLDDELTIQVA